MAQQKAISKLLDKNGKVINFDRWAYKNVNRIINDVLDLYGTRMSLTKDDLKELDKFVVYETDPSGDVQDTLYECDRSEFLNMIRDFYKNYTGYYPEEDEYDSKRWDYINSSCSRNSVNLNKIFSNDSGRKPVMSKITQRELRDMAENGQATDITGWDFQEIENLGSLEIIQVSKGIYGMNGALFKGEDGKLYVITARNTNLFRFV